jgi:hypothetical protein
MVQTATETRQAKDLFTEESRKGLAVLVLRLFDHWNLSTEQRLNLLGMRPTSRAVLGKYKKGAPLPPSRDVIDRAGWLLGIHKSLRLLYPRNEDIRYTWVCRRNEAFKNKAPIEVMTEEGLLGVAKVARYLDHLRGR